MIKDICFIAVIVVLGIFAASTLLAAEEGQSVLKITGLEGKVQVMIQPSTEWIDAVIGQKLMEGDSIKTLEDGKAHLLLNDKTGFVLQPNSEFVVEIPLAAEASAKGTVKDAKAKQVEKPVAEPYEEAKPAAPEAVYAPQTGPEEPASKI